MHPNAYDVRLDDGEGVTYDYDSDGNNIRIHYPDGDCERMFYDAEGNRIKHVLPESYDVQTRDREGWSYTYDNKNRMRTVTGPDGVLLFSAEYDLAGNLTAGRTRWGGQATGGMPWTAACRNCCSPRKKGTGKYCTGGLPMITT